MSDLSIAQGPVIEQDGHSSDPLAVFADWIIGAVVVGAFAGQAIAAWRQNRKIQREARLLPTPKAVARAQMETVMETPDPFAELKSRQRELWASFTPTAMFTTPVAARLVTFAGIVPGETVLDVATSTGVVAVTAARAGARVTGLDITPALLEQEWLPNLRRKTDRQESVMRNAGLVLLTCWCAMGFSGCGPHVPQPAVGLRGVPRISWVIMAGDRDNSDAQFICQSDPRTDCVLPASRPGAQVWSTLYIYYHGVGDEIRYTGSVRIGFFEGPATELHEIRPNIRVTRSDIMPQSVVDDVTTTPGTYAVTFDVLATTAKGTIQPMRDTVRVVVK